MTAFTSETSSGVSMIDHHCI